MAKAYSYDLRIKVMERIENGEKLKDVSQIFGIAEKTIIEWKKIKKETGDFKARPGNRTGNRRIIRDIEGFKEFIGANNDKSSRELAMLWHQKISSRSILRLLKKLDYSYKKNFLSPQKGCCLKS